MLKPKSLSKGRVVTLKGFLASLFLTLHSAWQRVILKINKWKKYFLEEMWIIKIHKTEYSSCFCSERYLCIGLNEIFCLDSWWQCLTLLVEPESLIPKYVMAHQTSLCDLSLFYNWWALCWTIKAKKRKITQISKAQQCGYKWDPDIWIYGFSLKHKPLCAHINTHSCTHRLTNTVRF